MHVHTYAVISIIVIMFKSLTGVTNHTNIMIMVAVMDTPAIKITIIKHLISSTTVYIVHPDLTCTVITIKDVLSIKYNTIPVPCPKL